MSKQNVDYKKMYYGFPIYLVSYYDENGKPNISTMSSSFSLGDIVVLGFGKNSYALKSIREMKQFVINIPNRDMMKEIEIAGSFSGRNYNKFDLCNLIPKKSEKINAPMIEECQIAIECVADQIIEAPNNPNYIIVYASIMGRIIDEKLLHQSGDLNAPLLDPVIYMGDDKMRYYRYLDPEKADILGSRLK